MVTPWNRWAALVAFVGLAAGTVLAASGLEAETDRSPAVVTAYRLHHVPAAVCAAALGDLVSVRTDQFTNSIIVQGPQPVQQRVRQMVYEIDQQVRPAVLRDSGEAVGPQRKTGVVMLEHMQSRVVAEHLRPLFQDQDQPHKLTWLDHNNAILMRGTPEELDQMASLIAALDVPERHAPAEEDKRVTRIMRLQYAQAGTVCGLLERCLAVPGSRQGLRLVPDDRLNALIVTGGAADAAEALRIARQLDVAVPVEE